MKDNELLFDRKSHVLYSKPCKKEIRAKIALHYPEAEREAIWEQVQRQYAVFLSDWRTDLGGKKNFHNGVGGTYDCIAIMSYYVRKAAATNGTITRCRLRLMKPTSLFIMNLRRARQRSLLSSTVLRILCPPCVMWTLRLWSCSMQDWCGRLPAWTAADVIIPSAATRIHI